MKKLITIASLVCSVVCAQTNVIVTNTPTISLPGLTLGGALPTNATRAANDILKIVEPIIPYLTNVHGVALDLDGIYSSGNKLGFLTALNVTIPDFMTNYLTVGVAVEDIADKWYVAPVDIKLGVNYSIPILNIPAYSFVGTGLSERISDGALGDQTLIGEAINVNLGASWYIVFDGGDLLLSQSGTPAQNWFGGFRVGKSF